LRVRCAVAVLSLLRALVLMSLKAGSVKGAGMELAVPGYPQFIRCTNEAGQVSKPRFGDPRLRVHVERPIDNTPRVAHICRRTKHVFAEQCRVSKMASHVYGQPPRSVTSIFWSILPRICSKLVSVGCR